MTGKKFLFDEYDYFDDFDDLIFTGKLPQNRDVQKNNPEEASLDVAKSSILPVTENIYRKSAAALDSAYGLCSLGDIGTPHLIIRTAGAGIF